MSKRNKDQGGKVIMAFMEAVYPGNAELAMTSFNEIKALQDATAELTALRAEVARLAGEVEVYQRQRRIPDNCPKIVCLCGSTRFWRQFQNVSLQETMAGRIVLSIGAASGTDDSHFGNLPREEHDRVKAELDELHKRKIDLADEIIVLNYEGYIGESTRSEIEHAKKVGKPIKYMVNVDDIF